MKPKVELGFLCVFLLMFFGSNGASTFPLSFTCLIVSKILTYLFKILSVRRPSRKISTIRPYHNNPRKRFGLKNTIKKFIKSMEILSLVKAELGNLND